MKEVVWVYGPSASGKERLIRFLISEDGQALRHKLGWTDKHIAYCKESVDHIAQTDEDDDPALKERENILKKVPELIKESDVVLVKGQFVDFKADYPQKLKASIPSAKHKIIYLQVSLDELTKRVVHKSWWEPEDDANEVSKAEVEEQEQQISGLKDDFEIIEIDSSEKGSYEFIKPAGA